MILRKLLAGFFAGGGQPADVGALMRQGQELQQSGEHEQAQQCYRSVLALQPQHAQAQQQLGHLLGAQGQAQQERGEPDAAIDSYLEALALLPEAARLRNNLGNAYRDAGHLREAIGAYRDALALEPGLAEAHLNLAVALHQDGASVEEAIAHCRRAIELSPALAEAHLNLGYLLEGRGDAAGAKQCYAGAIRARADLPEAHFNHALQLLLAGDYARGWEEYEWRLRRPDLERFWPFRDRPRWDGSAQAGKTILLYAEQGFGDAIQFLRYAPLVADRGGRVIVVCQPKLARLFASAPGVSAVHRAGEPDPEFDLCCSLLSLPRLFGTTLETIPASPYLRAGAGQALRWRERLAAEGRGLKVGLFWSTEAESAIGRMKSLDLESFAPLGAVPGVVFFSLQRGAAAAQIERPPPGMTIRDPTAELQDFADDAALIASLDLVVSIDTATAHLAGALGKPVWTLTHFPPEWRWLRDRDDSPWYPSMRLFRQRQSENWHAVVLRVAQALRERAEMR